MLALSLPKCSDYTMKYEHIFKTIRMRTNLFRHASGVPPFAQSLFNFFVWRGILFEKVWRWGFGRAKLLCALYCTLAIQCKFSYYLPMQSGKKLGENLRKLRLKKNLSQGNLARSLNVDRAYISNIENGRMNPTLSTLEKIAGALGISSSELLK